MTKAPRASDIRKVESNARHLLSLINDVLDLSKIESGKMEVFAETFDVAEMAGSVAATAQALIEKRGNTLTLRSRHKVTTPPQKIIMCDFNGLNFQVRSVIL